MATIRVCDKSHPNGPKEAEYTLVEENPGEHSEPHQKDLCAEHFKEMVSPFLTGGMKPGKIFTLYRIERF